MLRQIRLKNFVKFKEEQILDIKPDQDKPSVISILGPSGSGKSCFLEAFRRCTDRSNNGSVSTIPDKGYSIVVCTFNNEAAEEQIKFVSIYLSFYECKTRHTIKFLAQNGKERVYLLTRCDTEACSEYVAWRELYIDYDVKKLRDLMDIQKDLSEKAMIVRDIYQKDKKNQVESKMDQFDIQFNSLVKVEFIFPVRPLGPTQSSLQLLPKNRSKTSAYKVTTKNAFIIGEFLREQEKGPTQEYDEEIERKIYNRIVGADKVDFFMKEDCLIYAQTASSEFSLLKAPEGSIEAKYLSVLLSKTNVNILCIDEPCRGMNHDMINRLIYFVLPNKELVGNKQVILSTSNPDFLTPFLKQSTFLCLRNSVDTTKLIDANKKIKKISVSNDHLTAIVFSPRILFVEGPSDLLFVETMRHILLSDQDPFKKFRIETEGLDYFLLNVKMVPLNGCGNKNIEKVCTELGIKDNILFLFDNDVYPNSMDSPEDFAKRGIFVWDAKAKTGDGLNIPFENTKYDQLGYFLRNEKWVGMVRSKPFQNIPGTIEDVVLRVCVEHDVKHHNNQDEPCRVPGCDGLLNKLKQAGNDRDIHIVEAHPWNTCGCCKHEVIAMREKFLSQDLSQETIEDLIENILRVSIEYQEGEIWRFLEFLRTKSC